MVSGYKGVSGLNSQPYAVWSPDRVSQRTSASVARSFTMSLKEFHAESQECSVGSLSRFEDDPLTVALVSVPRLALNPQRGHTKTTEPFGMGFHLSLGVE